MSFGAPLWLFALMTLPLLATLAWRGQSRAQQRLTAIVAPRLRAQLVSGVHHGRRRARHFIFFCALALAILALAQPRYGFAERDVKRIGHDVLIAIDTSKSMLANDATPDRLTRARLAGEDLLTALPGDRVGLIAFAGGAFLQAPLTIDYSAVRESLEALDTSVIAQGGTDIAGAIRAATDAFGKSESNSRCLVIFSDGEDLTDEAVQAAKSVAGKIRIFTVGIGTTEGSLIPLPSEGGGTDFVRDEAGNFVKSHLDETRLSQIAEATGGFYLHLGDSLADMQRLVRDGIAGVEESQLEARLSRQPIERFQWPLGASLVLFALWHLLPEGRVRRPAGAKNPGPATVALALLLTTFSPAAQSPDPISLYQKGDFPGAYEAYQQRLKNRPNSPELQFNAGDSAFQAKEYQKAIEAFSNALATGAQLGPKSEYNLGSALFQRGLGQQDKETKKKDWKNALQHLDSVLKTEPQNADAKFNRDTIQKALEDLDRPPPEQKKQDEQKQQDQDQQKQQQKSGDSQNQQKQPSSSEQNQSQDQQSGGEKSDSASSKKNSESKAQPTTSPSPTTTPVQQNEASRGEKSSPSPSPSKQSSESAQAGPSPTPARDGKIESAGNQASPAASPSPGEQAAAGTAGNDSAAPGEMTPQQAAMLLESLKGDEKKVQLNEHRPTGPVLKDW